MVLPSPLPLGLGDTVRRTSSGLTIKGWKEPGQAGLGVPPDLSFARFPSVRWHPCRAATSVEVPLKNSTVIALTTANLEFPAIL
jgi:hypothetical protein